MSFMDIMNNMTVSSSKFTFSIIAIAALLIGGSAYLNQEANAAVPTFVAIHNSTTTTEIVFLGNALGVNGSGQLADWKVNSAFVTGITNGTAYAGTAASYGGTAVAVFNRTTNIMLTHADIGTSEVSVQYIKTGTSADIRSSPQVVANDAFDDMVAATITGIDQVAPTVVSAKMIDSKRIQVTFSEIVGNWNTTATDFTLGGAPGINIGSIVASNGTSGTTGIATPVDGYSNVVYLTTDQPIKHDLKYLTLSYDNQGGGWNVGDDNDIWPSDVGAAGHYLTDDTFSYKYGCAFECNTLNDKYIQYVRGTGTPTGVDPQNGAGVGNRLLSFNPITITNILTGGSNDVSTSERAPKITASSVQVNNGFIEALTDAQPVNVDVEVGDTVTFDFTITDEDGAYTIPSISLYTNFIDRPDDMNLFYTNNFDSVHQQSTSYYEWNVRSDDLAYDYANTVTWNPATYKSVDSETIEVSFSFNVDNTMNPSQVWVQVADASYNITNIQLPLTLDVTGDELLNFENTSNQKLIGFLNESVLSSIVSGWTTSNDDLANVVELSSALGVDGDRLPSWTTNLANWVVEDDINAAEMIVALEYIINQ